MWKVTIVATVGLVSASGVVAQTVADGDIVGRVLSDGVAVAHAAVIAVPAVKSGDGPYIRHSLTDGQGYFSISGVLGGSNTICVAVRGYLDPCRWGTPTVVNFQGQQISVNLQIGESRRIEVAIRDSNSVLSPGGFNIGVGVQLTYQNGATEPLPLVLRSGYYDVFAGDVPPGAAITVTVSGSGLQLRQGNKIPQTSVITTNVVAPATRTAAGSSIRLPFTNPSASRPDLRVDFEVVGKTAQ